VGAKRRLLPAIAPLLPPDLAERRYFEPFVGGGSLFFALSPSRAVLADRNMDLINAYVAVKQDVEGLIRELTWLKNEHSKENYYEVREVFNTRQFEDKVLRAAVFLYLHRSCFNGLYRENASGYFNVPLGDYADPDICNADALRRCSAILNQGQREIVSADFREVCSYPGADDFVYLDPPYDALEDADSFTNYQAGGFGPPEQRALAVLFREMDAQGAKLLLSNHDTPRIRELYKGYKIVSIEAPRSVGAKTRKSAPEVLVRNY
jgi:DNA adenine methylase